MGKGIKKTSVEEEERMTPKKKKDTESFRAKNIAETRESVNSCLMEENKGTTSNSTRKKKNSRKANNKQEKTR